MILIVQIYTFADDCRPIASQLIHNALLSGYCDYKKEFSALMVISSKNRNTLSNVLFRVYNFSIRQSFPYVTHQYTAHGLNFKIL